jgi:hypothetical protein
LSRRIAVWLTKSNRQSPIASSASDHVIERTRDRPLDRLASFAAARSSLANSGQMRAVVGSFARLTGPQG